MTDTQDVTITGLGYGGEGIARTRGFVLFVPRGLPGDQLRVRIRKQKKKYGSAVIDTILRGSPSRIQSKCPDFEKGCGGCQWLHFDYREQLFHKAKLVRDALKRIGKLNIRVEQVVPAHPTHGCRNKLSATRDQSGRIGLCIEKSRTVLDLEDCRMELPANVRVYRAIKEQWLPDDVTQVHVRSNSAGESGVCFFSGAYSPEYPQIAEKLQKQNPSIASIGVKTRGEYVHVAGNRGLHQRVGDIDYEIPTNSFFQSNYNQAAVLRDLVADAAALSRSDSVLDLYCGVGFFSLDLARRCRAVVGVEFDREAVRAARSNAKANGIRNARFEAVDSGRFLRRAGRGDFTTIVLDPPRAGVRPEVLKAMMTSAPRRIVYVSCAPDTLARDLQVLVEGGYEVRKCTPVDMFPQTYHVECVVSLKKKDLIPQPASR